MWVVTERALVHACVLYVPKLCCTACCSCCFLLSFVTTRAVRGHRCVNCTEPHIQEHLTGHDAQFPEFIHEHILPSPEMCNCVIVGFSDTNAG